MIKDCCTSADNLKVTETKGDLIVRTCSTCGCRHFELTVDPGQFGIKVQPLS